VASGGGQVRANRRTSRHVNASQSHKSLRCCHSCGINTGNALNEKVKDLKYFEIFKC
jgi:hypothetical protein